MYPPRLLGVGVGKNVGIIVGVGMLLPHCCCRAAAAELLLGGKAGHDDKGAALLPCEGRAADDTIKYDLPVVSMTPASHRWRLEVALERARAGADARARTGT